MIQAISLAVSLIAGAVFLITTFAPGEFRKPKVGDVYGHTNPGNKDDPREEPNPFVAMYEIVEVVGPKVRARCVSMRSDGDVVTGYSWWQSDQFSDDKLLKERK